MRKTAFISASIGILAMTLAACGKSMSASPTAPDSNTVAASTSATLSGTVGDSLGLGLASTTQGSVTGLTISVVGTSTSTTVDSLGRFHLVVTPSGNLQLKLNGAGVDSVVTVGDVAQGDMIELTIVVNGSTASIDDEDHVSHEGREIEGRVEQVPPQSAAGTFVVSGTTILTNGATVFRMGDRSASMADVLLGSRVHVKAAATAGVTATATALEVKIQNQQTQLPVQVNGTIGALAGTASAFSFTIDGRPLIGDAATEFNGNSAFSDMRNGARAEVKAEYRTTGLYATRIHVHK